MGEKPLVSDLVELDQFIKEVTEGLNLSDETLHEYREKMLRYAERKDLKLGDDKLYDMLILKALDNIDPELVDMSFDDIVLGFYENPLFLESDWTFVSSRIFMDKLYRIAAKNRGYYPKQKYGYLYDLLKILSEKGPITGELFEKYTREEIDELERTIDPELDKKHNYIGAYLMEERYLTKDYEHNLYELPQERYMIISMYIMKDEPKEKRMEYIKDMYWALSNKVYTVATPTMNNAGKSYGQLSSCFIDTPDDSLDHIFDSYHDIARLSKDGGGIGVYGGKLRGLGATIKNFVGVGGGTVPWAKGYEQVAVSVDQLGQRQGSICFWTDIWHYDIHSVLELRLNNGDIKQRTYELSIGVTIPDLFMELVEKGKNKEDDTFYLFDPHKVRQVMGWSLEDCYDEKRGDGTWRRRYYECVKAAEAGLFNDYNAKTGKVIERFKKVSALSLFKKMCKSQKETGFPFMMYRDEVNRMNPNKHAGMIYCSNLCSEIAQNQKPTYIIEETREGGELIIRKQLGDFVVCNLASLNLSVWYFLSPEDRRRAIKIAMRGLDNVIDHNKDRITVAQAVYTNERYRAVGLGTFGWHHLLAKKKIWWESEQAVQFADEIYEEIAYETIKASMELAKEKGAYPLFKGSDWYTSDYFILRGYINEEGEVLSERFDWLDLAADVRRYGVRNGYMMAVAPNISTAKLGGSTDGIDPVFQLVYAEEKKRSKIITPVPDLNKETVGYYKTAYDIDQIWSIKQNAARQRHIDQSISFNYYVYKDIKMSRFYELHMTAWKLGMKTSYYVRSTSTKVKFCESCAS